MSKVEVGVGVNDTGRFVIDDVTEFTCAGNKGDVDKIDAGVCVGAVVIVVAVTTEGSSINAAIFDHILYVIFYSSFDAVFLSSIPPKHKQFEMCPSLK